MKAAATPTLLRVISARECPQRFARVSGFSTESADMPTRALERTDTVSAVSLGSAVVSTGTWASVGNAEIITRKTTATIEAARSARIKKSPVSQAHLQQSRSGQRGALSEALKS